MKFLSTGIAPFLAINPLQKLGLAPFLYSGSGSGGGGGTPPPPPPPPDPEEPDPMPTGIRPEDEGRPRRYYAMLVGINKYPSPISELRGCVKDLDRIEGWLQSTVSDPEAEGGDPLRILRLQDEEATYENIKAGFRNHLRQAKKQDVVWFHFSGHGAEDFTAEEFRQEFEPTGKDQTLVCFQSSEDQSLHLADKELAVLLDEVARLDDMGRPKESPHIVVSLDCCHSGTGTRDFEMDLDLRTRHADVLGMGTRDQALAAKKVRSLDSYMDGYYARQWNGGSGRFHVPISKHVLLAACESVQTAGDLSKGGIFTNGLIEALEESEGEISYADLFSKTQASVFKLRKEQNPQFEPVANFYPYTKFLDGTPMGSPARYELVFEAGRWMIKCGAIHGLPVSPESPTKIEIFSKTEQDSMLGLATVHSTGAQKSAIQLTNGLVLDTDESYFATLDYLPVPKVDLWLHGDQTHLQSVKEKLNTSLYVQVVEADEKPDSAQIEVEVRSTDFLLWDHKRKKMVYQGTIEPDTVAGEIYDSAEKIVKWERSIRLHNKKSAISQWVDLKLDVINKSRSLTRYEGDKDAAADIHISASEADFIPVEGGMAAAFWPKLIVKESKQDLYCYLFHLRSDYRIESYEGQVSFRTTEHIEKSNIEIPLLTNPQGWGLEAGEDSTFSYFQVLITTEELDHNQLVQAGIGSTFRDLIFEWKPMQVENDWCTKLIKVTLTQ
ncbi:MAG: caspase family protein [Bacteroidota bacterium]